MTEEVLVEWGVRTSNGSVRVCDDENSARTLLARSLGWGCRPGWQIVTRAHRIGGWAASDG